MVGAPQYRVGLAHRRPLIVATALSRLYLGVHYWADVVASPRFVGGTALGLVAVLELFGLAP